MRNTMKIRLPQLVRQAECGVDTMFAGMWYTVLLFVMFVVLMEFGNTMYTTSSAYNAARAAAQDAAKKVDRDEFLQNQVVVLNSGSAEAIARDTFENIYTSLPLSLVVIAHPDATNMRYVEVAVEIEFTYPILNSLLGNGFGTLVGNSTAKISAFAEPAFGIDDEQQ